MKFKGKIDIWFWIIMFLGEVAMCLPLFTLEKMSIIGVIGFLFYNAIFLPFVVRNYVEVSDDKVTICFGFSKDSIEIADIKSVHRTSNPIASSAASLDRIMIQGSRKQMMCAVKEREQFFDLLQEKNPNIKIERKRKKFQGENAVVKASLIFCVATFVIVGILLVTGDITIHYEEEFFQIEASYYPDKEVVYEDIEAIEFRDEKIRGTREGGWGSFRLLMGKFENNEFGRHTKYAYVSCDAGVVLTLKNGNIFVITGKNPQDTREIYEKLLTRIP